MATVDSNFFELMRRGFLWTSVSTLDDEVTPMTWDADPNTVVNGNTAGETKLYAMPIGAFYMETDGTLWFKNGSPNTWTKVALGEDVKTDTMEPHGIIGSPTISWNSATRTVTIAHPYGYYYQGTKVISTVDKSVVVDDITGTYYISFSDAAHTAAAGIFNISNVPYASVYWNAVTGDNMFFDERHGIVMDTATHGYLHHTQGAQYESGGVASGYVQDSDLLVDVQIAISETVFHDEDIEIIQAVKAEGDNWDKWYRSGASGIWTKDTADTIAAFHALNVPKINTYVDPDWELTSVTNNYYFNTYIFATNSVETTNRFIVIPGQTEASSIGEAQEEGITGLSLGDLPANEIIPLFRITWQYKTAQTGNDARLEIKNVTDLRSSNSPSVAAGISTNHNSLAGRTDEGAHPSNAITSIYIPDAINWEGTATTYTYDVSAYCDDATRFHWKLKDNANNYVDVGGVIDHPTLTGVRITFSIPIDSGTYTLVGR